MDPLYNEHIEKIIFTTTYPTSPDTSRMIVIALTNKLNQVLIYSGDIKNVQLSFEQVNEYQDALFAPKTVLRDILHRSKMVLNGELKAISPIKGIPYYFMVVALEGPRAKQTIKKSEIEKLFGCEIEDG